MGRGSRIWREHSAVCWWLIDNRSVNTKGLVSSEAWLLGFSSALSSRAGYRQWFPESIQFRFTGSRFGSIFDPIQSDSQFDSIQYQFNFMFLFCKSDNIFNTQSCVDTKFLKSKVKSWVWSNTGIYHYSIYVYLPFRPVAF